MTRFAQPDIIACPHCNTRYLRKVLLSFNTLWQIRYSDGGTKNGIQDTVINESRCVNCRGIIKNIQNLDIAEQHPKNPFWKKWLSKTEQNLYLSAPSFDVYFELFEKETNEIAKLNWGAKALQVFNQIYRIYGKERDAEPNAQQQYTLLVDYLLQRYSPHASEELILICADIYRQMGDFQMSLHLYQKVDSKRFIHIVEPAKFWCEKKITSLMEVDSYRHGNSTGCSSREAV